MAKRKTPITIDALHEHVTLSEQNMDSWKGTIAGKITEINNTMWAVIVVLVFGFVTLLVAVAGLVITYQHDSQDVYQQSRDATNAQNDKIDAVLEVVKDLNEQNTIQTTD